MSAPLNVLLVVLDGVRADHVSCYGWGRETTPFLDQVAREGVRFSHAIATSAGTLPSHGALFTGLHSVTHGATEETGMLSGRHRVLAEYLKGAGYRTAAFCTNPSVSPETGFGRGFDAFYTQRRSNRFATRALLYGRRASDRLLRRGDAGARRTNEALLQWLAANNDPFFAFIQYHETHVPLQPPPPYDRRFLAAGKIPRGLNQDSWAYLAGDARLEEEDAAALNDLYDGALYYVDSRLQEIGNALRARGDWDQTLVIVTSDHGENLGAHGIIGHEVGLHETLLRVPLVLRCPSRVPQGFIAEDLAQHSDVVPTILRLLEIEDGGPFHGRALLDQGRATQGPTFTVSERFRPNLMNVRQRYPDFDARPYEVRSKAIRTPRQKFVWHSDEANELYDLVADPGETRNLIDTETGRADALRRQLFDWLAQVEKYDSFGQGAALDQPLRSGAHEAGTSE